MPFSFGRVGVLVVLGCCLSVAHAGESAAAATAVAVRPALLDAAFNAFAEHQGRWAFTETHSAVAMDGKPRAATIFRVDPSLPYAEQFTPVQISGKAPNEKQRKNFAEIGVRNSKRRQQAEQEEKSKVHRDDEVRLQINGQSVTPDLAHAVVVAEDENGVTYEVPMRKQEHDELFDKFQLTARVNKLRQEFEHVTIRQCAAMRVQLVAKVTDSVIEIEFGSPDPRYPALPMKTSQQATIRILFGKPHTVHDESLRTDVTHVTPYDERFGVKIGPMRTIEL